MVAGRKRRTRSAESSSANEQPGVGEWKTLEGVRVLTHAEGRELFDRQARKWLGISGEEFLRRWQAGEIEDPDQPDIMEVLSLLSFAR